MSLPDIRVEVAFDSGWSTPAADRTWTDISDYVEVAEGLSIGVGRQDEFTSADANTLSLTLDNTDGRFTPGLASSPYYPDVRIGRPIRVYVDTDDAPENLLTDNQASFETSVSDWRTSGLSSAYSLASLSHSTARSWHGTDSLLAQWPTTPTASFGSIVGTEITVSIGVTYTFSAHVWVPPGSPPPRVEVIPLPGEGSVFAASDRTSATGAWVRLSVTFTAATTDYLVGVQVGAATSGDQCWVDAAMLNQGGVVAPFTIEPNSLLYRFVGYIDSLPVTWPGGSDAYAKVQVSASSRLSRLGSARQLRSIIEEQVLQYRPSLYYTLGDMEGSIQAAESSGNDGPPLVSVGDGDPVTFGSATGPGTDDLTAASFAGGKHLAADVDGLTLVEADGWWVAFTFNTTETSTSLLDIEEAVEFIVDAGGALQALSTIFLNGPVVNDGETHRVILAVDATNNDRLYVDGVLADTGIGVNPSNTVTALTVGRTEALDDVLTGAMSHVSIGAGALTDDEITALDLSMRDGFAGDTPGDRVERYAAFAGVLAAETELDTGATPIAHADTTGATALEMMRKVELAEGGVLFDAVDGSLAFHHRARRYTPASQFTIEAAGDYLEADYNPTLDTSGLQNTVTAQLADGTLAAVAVNAASVDDHGPRGASLDLITDDANEAHAAAWWRVNTYAEPRLRVPTLSVNLLAFDAEDQALVLGLTVGSRITVTGLPDQVPNSTEDYFIEGYSEQITPESYVLTFNVSPAEPYLSTWVLDSATRSQLGTSTRLAY